jgi:hypothetical protein
MRRGAVLAAVLGAATQWACLVQITRVSDPRPLFDEARREAGRHAGRKGPARELNVLVWEADERKLVRVSVPMWVVRAVERRVDWERELGDDDEQGRVVRRVRRHVRLEDIEKAGLGLLAEVEGEDGEQVLVWLK